MSGFTMRATATYRPRTDVGQFIAEKIAPAAAIGVQQAAEIVLEEAKEIVAVDTGELRESGHIGEPRDTGKTVVCDVIFDADHAAYVEFGTGQRGAASAGAGPYPYAADWPGMEAQPYLRPALDTTRQVVREQMASAIALGLKK